VVVLRHKYERARAPPVWRRLPKPMGSPFTFALMLIVISPQSGTRSRPRLEGIPDARRKYQFQDVPF
jgi:hypothetical protein